MVLTVGVMTLANQCAVIAAPDDLAYICEFPIPGRQHCRSRPVPT